MELASKARELLSWRYMELRQRIRSDDWHVFTPHVTYLQQIHMFICQSSVHMVSSPLLVNVRNSAR